ncbi:unnamed protein product [Symbiodinium sp. CCMP2456]|nr:unnamed protein product [Symbiodinium sp. CCMP2456]
MGVAMGAVLYCLPALATARGISGPEYVGAKFAGPSRQRVGPAEDNLEVQSASDSS